jgi:flagellar basal body-associated protein FliL
MSDEELMQEGELEERVVKLQKRTKLLTMMLVLTLAMAGGSAAYAFISVKSVGEEVQAVRERAEKIDAGREDALEGIKADAPVGIIHPLGNFVVNLLDPGNLRYVNCRIELEVDDSLVIKSIQQREALFKDSVISLVGNQTYEDLLGVEGKSRLREELLVRFNRILPDGQIARVYLTEFVVQ